MKVIAAFLLSLMMLTGCGQTASEELYTAPENQTVMDSYQLRQIAYDHAGVLETAVWDLDEDWKQQADRTVYELDFEAGAYEYEYRIDAATGQILSAVTDAPAVQNPSEPTVTPEEAKRIALEHAGLNEGAVKNLRVEYDRQERCYEVEFTVKRMEYDYEIDGSTGAVLQAEKDRQDLD